MKNLGYKLLFFAGLATVGFGLAVGTGVIQIFAPSEAIEVAEKVPADDGHDEALNRIKAQLNALRARGAAPTTAELDLLRAQLELLNTKQQSIQKELERLAEEAKSEAIKEEKEPAPEAQEQQMAAHLDALEFELNAQETDYEWSSEIKETVKNGFRHPELKGLNLTEAQCASTMCRVEVSVEPGVAPEDGFNRLSVHRPWQGESFVKFGTDGVATIYFARQGHRLPRNAQPNEES